MTRIESGVSLYDYTKLMILGELMETGNSVLKRRETQHADRLKMSESDFIKITICNEENIPSESLLVKSRKSEIREARQIAMYFCRELTSMSFNEIGKSFGLDHATVIHACKVVANQMLFNAKFRSKIEHLKKCITEN